MKKRTLMSGMMILSMMALTVIGQAQSSEPSIDTDGAVIMEAGVPGGVIVNTLEIHAKVVAIDYELREVGLLMPGGGISVVAVGPEAINFKQIKKGDLVKALLVEELVIGMGSDESDLDDGEAVVVVGAPEGATPGGVAIDTVRSTAIVTALDGDARTATLRFEDGRRKTITVRDDIDLTQHRLGETVVFQMTKMLALSVEKVAPGIAYEQDGAKTVTLEMKNLRDARFCEIFFIKVKGNQNELHVYNPTGLNNMKTTQDSCPDTQLKKLDLAGLKEHYKLDGIYFNKPRHWIMDEMLVPVGAKRVLCGMEYYWMASSHMPKSIKFTPGFLTYKKAPVERKTTLTFKAGKSVFLLDDPDGKVWIMKAYRDSYGQSYETLKDLGKRYKKLPAGYKARVKVLEKDLILRPTGGVATVMQDEFENTYDYLGDGCANYMP